MTEAETDILGEGRSAVVVVVGGWRAAQSEPLPSPYLEGAEARVRSRTGGRVGSAAMGQR